MLTLNNGCLYSDELPEEAIAECSAQGQCDEAVSYWRKKLAFTVSREYAISGLRRYGAWSQEELQAKSDEDLAETILWIACGSFSDGETLFCLEG